MENKTIKEIYGTVDNLDTECVYSKNCWENYEQYRFSGDDSSQKPYHPYFGNQYTGLLTVGINLNGGNTSVDAIDSLVSLARIDLDNGKQKIFKQEGYGGSLFYYHVPMMGLIYTSLISDVDIEISNIDLSPKSVVKGFDYIGLTNLIKCSTSNSNRSIPSENMYHNCTKLFLKELDIIQYELLVLFTKNKKWEVRELVNKFDLIKEEDGFNLYKYNGHLVLEFGHPMATNLTNDMKNQYYYNGIKEAVKLLKA